ncbi:MAG: hypothetical protein D6722_28335 [Bacteroidetes bacterium]|nr:MAG: hypothetical protein D6722_28335 [Bacteroidota bacterium]
MLSACSIFRQTAGVPIDTRAETLIDEGKRLMQAGKYADALDAFEMARDRAFHRNTTVALYLAGLAAYEAGYDDVALQRFEILERLYPRSRYLEDANYHRALISLRNWRLGTRFEGLDQLIWLAEDARSPRLRTDAQAQAQLTLFEDLPLEELQQYYERPEVDHRGMVLEALAYRLMQAGRLDEADLLWQAFLAEGQAPTPFLEELFSEVEAPAPDPVRFEPNILRLAVVLPLFAQSAAYGRRDVIPANSLRGLEFYEGLQMAVAEQEGQMGNKQVYVQVFDSQRDTAQVRAFFSVLDSVQPHVIVGDIYNSESRVLSDWARQHKVPQMVPISPSEELVEGEQYVFLAHPSAETHGRKMAEYAWYQLFLQHVCVFSDRSSGTEPLAEGFIEAFSDLGGTIDTFFLSTNYEDVAIEQIPDFVDEVPDHLGNVGVYIPLMSNEESAGLIVNLLKQRNKEVVVMGSPHFRSRYNTIDRDTKDSFGLLFSSSHMVDPTEPAYRMVYDHYLETYGLPPSENVIQGYDLGRYLLHVLNSYDPAMGGSLDTYLRVAPTFEGLHLNYRFKSSQSNQQVNIGQYTPEGIIIVEK